jgi:hypothetical protein
MHEEEIIKQLRAENEQLKREIEPNSSFTNRLATV